MNSVPKNNLLQSALYYLEKYGFSVIPVRPDKKPFIRWEEFQKRKATPEEIKKWFTQWTNAMIGIVTGSISGVVVIDIDNEEGKKAIHEFIPESLVIPTVRTPRGGQHLYFKTLETPISNKTGIPRGCDFRGEGGYVIAPPSRNCFGRAYQWIVPLEDAPLPELPKPYINNYLLNYIALGEYKRGDVTHPLCDTKRPQTTPSDVKMFVEGRRDEDLFHIANCLVKGGAKEYEILQVLEILTENCDPPFPLKEIPKKLDSALKRAKKREWNISEEVREFVVTSSDVFLTSDIYQRLQVTSRDDKKAIVKTLLRLVEEGVIERVRGRNGAYRRIEKECEEIDFLHASDEFLTIQYPFGIERYFQTLPKNIIVVAGSKDAGKTAFLLNFVRLNMDHFKIHYYSSEMGAMEFRKRLEKFGYPLESWKFYPKERNRNFADVIYPNDVNVIDYLEVDEDFYRVGGMLKEIHQKLNQGIAIVALQKNRGRDTGVGGERSLEKPRLYISLECGKAKLIVAKNWATNVNPVGLQLDFKLDQGCKFIILKDWYRA